MSCGKLKIRNVISINMDQDNKNNEGIDLSGALKDSSTGVKFEGEQRYARSYYPGTPKVIQWVITYSGGLVKDEKQASYVLIGFFILVIVIFLMFIFGSGSNQPTSGTIPPDQFVPQ
ncbi:MAG: hypothetical protein AUJ11_00935 [Parcubacteria group bacterium CG1_02_44_65]|nr:MAG: hypothetical protein AUJ11_00935 [Parcubacteria group bacterium CG1_02_44_65]